MYGKGKGISASALPYKKTPPSWLKITATEVEEHCCRLAKKGLTPSQIGVRCVFTLLLLCVNFIKEESIMAKYIETRNFTAGYLERSEWHCAGEEHYREQDLAFA